MNKSPKDERSPAGKPAAPREPEEWEASEDEIQNVIGGSTSDPVHQTKSGAVISSTGAN